MTKQEFDTAYNEGYKNGYEAGRNEGSYGEWEKHGKYGLYHKCSKCGEIISITDNDGEIFPDNYCSNCGAKMDMRGKTE